MFVDVTKQSDMVSIKSSVNGDPSEINIQSDDFYDSYDMMDMVNVPEKLENNSDYSELSQNVDNFCENVLGSYYFKK